MRPDVEALIMTWHKKDQKVLLEGWGRNLVDDLCDAIPDEEPVLSVAKTHAPDLTWGLGVSAVTPSALVFFLSNGDQFVLPLSEILALTTRGVGGSLQVTLDHQGQYRRFSYGEKREAANHFVDALEVAIQHAHSAPPPQAGPPAVSAADELAKFAALREQGILTEDEFQSMKRQLLDL